MHLSPHSLRQINGADLQSLEVEALRGLSMRLLADIKEAWDRLNQGPENSSQPTSSRAPWERKNGGERETDAEAEADAMAADDDREPEPVEPEPTRKPGKQNVGPNPGQFLRTLSTPYGKHKPFRWVVA